MASDVAYSSKNIAFELLPKFRRLNENQQKVVTYDSGPYSFLPVPVQAEPSVLPFAH